MEYAEILDKWAKYTNYNPEQNSFNMANYSYEIHQTNKKIERILEAYDNTGALAIIQAKIMFEKILKNSTYNAFEYMKNPNIVKVEQEIWNMFHCDEVMEIEKAYVDSINQLSDKIIGKLVIGERNNEDVLNDLFEATDIVIESLDKCNRDLFTQGDEILPITKISTHIHLFETLAECLVVLENSSDGLYLCYINCGGTADGYFSFFLKSNGNLLSINERIDEAYSGQHSHSRNGRWTESKKYELFPYEYIFNYAKYDYKGYANSYLIDEEKLAFFELGHKIYLPIIIAMIMIGKQYVGKKLNMNIKFVDSLLPINVNQIAETNNKLMIIDNSNLMELHNNIDLSFELEKIINGDYSEEFSFKSDKDYRETGVFTNSNQMFVDLWGKDFKYDPIKIYRSNSILRITDNNANTEGITPEFVGTKDRIRLQGYYQIRKELANYIRDKMYNEWVNFGKTVAIKKWYIDCIKNNINEIEKLIAEKYINIQNGDKNLSDGWHSTNKDTLDIYYVEQKYPDGWGNIILNNRKDKYKDEFLCTKTGSICSIFFTFAPKDWKQLELLCGIEVPKILKGWCEDGHFGDGNSILSATDMVTQVGTPFERYETNKYEKLYNENAYDVKFDFKFSIGYSKRGIKEVINKYK